MPTRKGFASEVDRAVYLPAFWLQYTQQPVQRVRPAHYLYGFEPGYSVAQRSWFNVSWRQNYDTCCSTDAAGLERRGWTEFADASLRKKYLQGGVKLPAPPTLEHPVYLGPETTKYGLPR